MTAACALAGALVGGLACPVAARAMLERKRRDIRAYFDERVAQYRAFLEEDAREPKEGARGLEGALAIWAADVRAQAEKGKLPREQAAEFAGVCKGFKAPEGLPSEDRAYASYMGPVSLGARVACAAFMAASLGLLAHLEPSLLFAACAAATLTLAGVTGLCDWKAHIIPFELSYALVPAGIACQAALIVEGSTTLASAGIGFLAYVAFIFGSSWIVGKITGRKAIGAGDVRSTPGMALVSASAPLVSLLASAATTLVVPVARLFLKTKGVLTMSTPFGPHLAIGMAAGLLWPLAYGGWLPL